MSIRQTENAERLPKEVIEALDAGNADIEAGRFIDWEQLQHEEFEAPTDVELLHSAFPSDPTERAKLFAELDAGIAQAEAGQTITLEEAERLLGVSVMSLQQDAQGSERRKLFAMLDAGNADIEAGRYIAWDEIKRIWANKRAATNPAALLDPLLPTDPVELAAFDRRVDAATKDFKAGKCIPWEQVDAQLTRDIAKL